MISRFSMIIALLISLVLVSCAPKEKQDFNNFITSDGYLLKDGDSTFRFISFNIPNLNFVEDEMAFTKPHAFRLPTSYEIKDALESVKQMGGTVVRNYTFPVKRETDTLDIPRYILGPGEFNEEAFVVMDSVLAIANEVGVRLILPFLNNWKWMGGVPQYAGFRDKVWDDFWIDSLLISDFKKTLEFVLNRTNTVTGVKYKDDKSILCWETGNELVAPYSWTEEIVTYVKSIDTNHLVMDGFHAIDGVDIPIESIENSLIDIVTTHQYKLNPNDIMKDIEAQMNRVDGRKPYIVGEFGFLGTNAVGKISDFIIRNDKISGGLIWSLRHHREEGGYYWHSEPHGGDIYKAFHWPGNASGLEYNEEELMPLIREKAFEIRGLDVPEVEIPEAPVLLQINEVSKISWKGSVGAKAYDIERSESKNGNWKVVGLNISDAIQTYTDLFNDVSVEVGKEYYYRVAAKNESGISEYSNIVGPVKASSKMLIDDMKNFTVLYYGKGRMKIKTDKDREFKEIMNRIEAEEGSKLIYYVPGGIKKVRVYSFSRDDASSLNFSISANGEDFKSVKVNRNAFYLGKGDYAYWIPSLYEFSTEVQDSTTQFVRIDVAEINQIGRVEIDYTD